MSEHLNLPPEHANKIVDLHPHLRSVINAVLKSHGIDAQVHQISFRPAAPNIAMAGCQYINGVWTCG
jgi:hypothetical protein